MMALSRTTVWTVQSQKRWLQWGGAPALPRGIHNSSGSTIGQRLSHPQSRKALLCTVYCPSCGLDLGYLWSLYSHFCTWTAESWFSQVLVKLASAGSCCDITSSIWAWMKSRMAWGSPKGTPAPWDSAGNVSQSSSEARQGICHDSEMSELVTCR